MPPLTVFYIFWNLILRCAQDEKERIGIYYVD